MTWAWWLAGAVVVVVLLDRLGVWAERRGWIYWRSRHGGGGGASAVLGDVLLLFQPTREHVVAEQERQRLTIAYPEDGEPLRVDLDAGTAVVPAEPEASGDVAAPLDGEDGARGPRP